MKKGYCLLFCVFFLCKAFSQSAPKWDTLKYQKFKYNLIVGVYQSYRNFENEFAQTKNRDTALVSHQLYSAESRLISGIDLSYDKLSLSLGLRSKPPEESAGKGQTRNLNANLNFGGNIWYFQNCLRYFKGFYDANTVRYDTTIRQTGRYYQRPDMELLLLRSKFLYFTNHRKYAFRAGYSGNYRQLRSAATWIFSGNINFSQLSSDSSLFGYASRPFYGEYSSMQALRVVALAANAGAAGTLVILKGFFLSGMFIVGPEQQWRTYTYDSNRSLLSYLSVSGDLRVSIGVNLKRCYFIAFNSNDFSIYNGSFAEIKSRSLSGGFSFGWRFNSTPSPLYEKFQKTKFYKAI